MMTCLGHKCQILIQNKLICKINKINSHKNNNNKMIINQLKLLMKVQQIHKTMFLLMKRQNNLKILTLRNKNNFISKGNNVVFYLIIESIKNHIL